jgi:hypothetical protein
MWTPEMSLFLFIGSFFALVTTGKLRSALMITFIIISGLNLLGVVAAIHLQMAFLDYQIIPCRDDKLSLIFFCCIGTSH